MLTIGRHGYRVERVHVSGVLTIGRHGYTGSFERIQCCAGAEESSKT